MVLIGCRLVVVELDGTPTSGGSGGGGGGDGGNTSGQPTNGDGQHGLVLLVEEVVLDLLIPEVVGRQSRRLGRGGSGLVLVAYPT